MMFWEQKKEIKLEIKKGLRLVDLVGELTAGDAEHDKLGMGSLVDIV